MAAPRPASSASYLLPRYWPTWLLFGSLWLSARLPQRFLVPAGRITGRMLRWINPYRRSIVQRNLEICFSAQAPKQRADLLGKNFESLGISLLETATAAWAPAGKVRELGSIQGLEHLEAGLRKGRGAILLSGHFNSPDFCGRLLTQHLPVCFTYQEFRNPLFDSLMQRIRRRHCPALIHRHDMRGMIRALRDNQVLWYAPDQDQGERHSVFVPFFGKMAATLTTTTRLARLTGAAVLPLAIQRSPDNSSYRLTIHPAWKDYPGKSPTEDALRFNRMLESWIRISPEQYNWAHRRFKTRPDNETAPYPEKPRRIRRKQREANLKPG